MLMKKECSSKLSFSRFPNFVEIGDMTQLLEAPPKVAEMAVLRTWGPRGGTNISRNIRDRIFSVS
jgi:hypothetical protein